MMSPGAAEIAALLAQNIETLCMDLLPNGRREGHEWRCGNIHGEPGDSLGVHLTGDRAGVWADFASDESGDALDLIASVRGVAKLEALALARDFLRLPRTNGATAPKVSVDAITKAQAIAAKMVPVMSTAAARYLESRGIDPSELGADAGFIANAWKHDGKSEGALAVVARDEAGDVVAVQQIYFVDGRKATKAEAFNSVVKRTNGRPGQSLGWCIPATADQAERIIVTEGPEDAATAAQVTGLETHAALGIRNFASVVTNIGSGQIILAADPIGHKDAEKALMAQLGKLRDAGVAVLFCRHPKHDLNALLQAEGADAVRALIDSAGPPEPNQSRRLRAVDIGDFLSMEILPREMVLAPVLPSQGLAMLYAARGVGKTFVGLSMAYAVATGGTFFRWQAPEPRRVLYIDGEMPASAMQECLAQIVQGSEKEPSADFLRVITPDLQENGIPDISSTEGQSAIEDYLEGVSLVIVDNLSTLCRYGRENEAESWEPMQEWLLSLRRRGFSVLLVHHAGKGGNQRGTSKREDCLDTVICLKRPQDYQAEDGARFEVHLEKARGVVGEDAKSFEARLEVRDNAAFWTTRDIEDRELEQVVELTRAGDSVRDIAEETSMSKSKVNRLQKRAKTEGRLT